MDLSPLCSSYLSRSHTQSNPPNVTDDSRLLATIHNTTIDVNTEQMFTRPLQYIGFHNNFILPQPSNNKKWYSPLESLNLIISNADKKGRLILDLPRNLANGLPQYKPLTESLIIKLMILKKRIPVNRSTMYTMLHE